MRAIWKGAVTFGLVHIPVALYPLAKRVSLDFDWLDKRTMHPVGYQRIDKTTGKKVESADIARGIAVEKGHYVILTDEEIKAARSAAVQEVELLAFVDQGDLAFALQSPQLGTGHAVMQAPQSMHASGST